MDKKTFAGACILIILLQMIVMYIQDCDIETLREKVEERDQTIKELVQELNDAYD